MSIHSQSTKNRGKKGNLVLQSPKDVCSALKENDRIKGWLNFVAREYLMPRKRIALFYPCSATKPYLTSRSYKILSNTLESLGDLRNQVHLVTVSEPFGLVPEEFYGTETWDYDCPGLFEWWCIRNNVEYDYGIVDECITMIAESVARFLKRNERKRFDIALACVRYCSSSLRLKPDHTHRRILEKASKISRVPIEFLPDASHVTDLVDERGAFAWDMYGPAHPMMQDLLRSRLEVALNGKY